jgi:hypothetical protein
VARGVRGCVVGGVCGWECVLLEKRGREGVRLGGRVGVCVARRVWLGMVKKRMWPGKVCLGGVWLGMS